MPKKQAGTSRTRKRPEGPSPEEKLVSSLIELMQSGVAPWRREWDANSGGHHVNLFSGHRYRGTNPVLLTMGMHMRGSALPFWCGFNEAKSHGVAPRKGSKAVYIFRPLPVAVKDEESGDVVRSWMSYRPIPVFNAADLEGEGLEGFIAARKLAEGEDVKPEPERLEAAEAVLSDWEVPVARGGDKACYAPGSDRIILPERGSFHSPSAHYATWAHEAVHSTGHTDRLARNLSGAFGSKLYAREELVAELGAVLLGDRLEIGSDTQNHAAYLSHWIQLLQEEPKQLLACLGDARKAVELIAPEQQEQSQA